MRRLGWVGVWLVAGGAWGMTTDGSLLTNIASATYMITAGTGATVSYVATADVLIATPQVVVGKVATPTLMTTGGPVTFCITYSNESAWGSAVNVVITDALPDNMRWTQNGVFTIAEPADGGTPVGPTAFAYATSLTGTWTSSTGPYTQPNTGQAGPLYMRWTIPLVGPQQSGVVCYTALIL